MIKKSNKNTTLNPTQGLQKYCMKHGNMEQSQNK